MLDLARRSRASRYGAASPGRITCGLVLGLATRSTLVFTTTTSELRIYPTSWVFVPRLPLTEGVSTAVRWYPAPKLAFSLPQANFSSAFHQPPILFVSLWITIVENVLSENGLSRFV